MARYILASGVDQFFGSRGGATFQRSGKVFAIRKRAVPVQKRTIKQSGVKNAFDVMVKRFKDLNNAQKATWTTFKNDYPRIDSLGNSYVLPGQTLQTSSNLRRISTGQTQSSSLAAAIAYVPLSIVNFSIVNISSTMRLQVSPTNVQASCRLVYYAGRPTATKEPIRRENLKLLAHLNAGASTATPNAWSVFIALYGIQSLTNNNFVPIIADVVQQNSGQVIGSLEGYANITT